MTESPIKHYLHDDIADIETTDPWKGLVAFKANIRNCLPAIPAESPILLSGDWGAGKTSLLRALKKDFDSNHDEYIAVWFDAWRYENEDGLLAALTRKIWQTLKNNSTCNTEEPVKYFNLALKLCLKMKFESLASVLSGTEDNSQAIEEVNPATIENEQNSANLETQNDAVDGVNKEDKSIIKDVEKKIKKFDEKLRELDISPTANRVDILSDAFQRMIKMALNKNRNKEKKLIIMIDDLDRCSPATAISLLDNVRQLVNETSHHQEGRIVPAYRFVIAMDKTTLTESVARKYEGLNSYDGNRYLEKLFPFNFQVPALTEDESFGFVKQQINLLIIPDKRDLTLCYDFTVDDIGQLLANELKREYFSNPRLIKRCINKFFMFCSFEGQLAVLDNKETVESKAHMKHQQTIVPLITWIAATERWPILRRLLRQKYQEFWTSIHDNIANKTPLTDNEAKQLLGYKGFKIFFQQTIAYDINKMIKQFQIAEGMLRKHGI